MAWAWEEAMWAELASQSPTDQIVTAGEWITRIQQSIVAELAKVRRDRVLELLSDPDWDATRIAESIGARRATITRLAEEGRAARREENARPR